ncbi:hypothetical protein VF14_08945 [Nostoc linckia z18]|uniref:Uncharacterized protein n=2 Tax=Nostoc linckia TaxID=92942 RepID=A0A9Q6EMH7_NOSLI|nr:hypothetical protein [Nostoc linckia]PHK42569.1 hypothetical protein VF12_02590 [Nostoc linckia z15]PHK44545.1 hypothetical protein VF13_21295 [Nostoc linckia z16]PHJ59589.1 hypothetical protein VF02_24570 [Nostoc linckia z1]PHJ65133.1 hypothetical protein VF05_21580 [Nostoc linckia z3]PHJ69594.1 hypothetical protein VF03_23650 [Nostoc linckia z2]
MPINNCTDLLDGASLYEGQVANLESSVIRTAANADTDILVFGRALVKGSGDKDLILPVDANSLFMGIAYATDTIEKRSGFSINADGDFGYPLDWTISYLVRGVIGVKVVQNVNPASNVFWIHTPQTGQRKGQFRADADTNRAVQITNARFMKSGTAGSVVPLSINLA